jgi:hypothetical protein
MNSYKTEVYVDRKWCGNNLRFATEVEAVEYGKELLSRWYVPTDSRAVTSDDKVNYRFNFETYKAEPVKA